MSPLSVANRTGCALVGAALLVSGLPGGRAAAAPAVGHALVADAVPAAPVDEPGARAAFGRLPLSLEENRGQTNPEVRFLAHGVGFNLFLTASEAVVARRGGTVRMRFPAARRVTGEERLPGTANYLVGADPSRWQQRVPTWGRARLEGVFAGVDLVVYGTKASPEYDFVVAPGADPDAISFEIEGARSIRVDASGDLLLETPGGVLRHKRPVVYQPSGGPGECALVSGAYTIAGRRVGFRVGAYDRSLPLVIDPQIVYSTYLGGEDFEDARDIAVDTSGNVYVTGLTESRDFPLRNEFQDGPLIGDAYVTKLNASGTALVFSTYLGGADADRGSGIDVDASGRVFVAGDTFSQFFPLRNEYMNALLFDGGDQNAFLTVLTSAGDDLVYSTLLAGRSFDLGTDVAVDIHGNAFLVGHTNSQRFPTKSPSPLPPFQSERAGGEFLRSDDGFVAKFDPDEEGENSLVYSTLIGGDNQDKILAVAVDEFERAYVTGITEAKNFPCVNALQGEFGGGGQDAFIAKFNADGTTVFFSTYFGGSENDQGHGIALDTGSSPDPLPVVTGTTVSPDIRMENGFQLEFGGAPNDGFVVKLAANGEQVVFSTYLGGDSGDEACDVATDPVGNVYVTGESSGSFPLRDPLEIDGRIVEEGLYVAKLGLDGQLLFSTFIGPALGRAIISDQGGDVYVIGETESDLWPVVEPAFLNRRAGALDAVIFKIDMVDDDTIATYNPVARLFSIRNANLGGPPDLTVLFGVAGDRPLSGDWNADGQDTIGVYTPATGTFSIRDVNEPGPPNPPFTFGAPNLQPIKGDWDGDGLDTIGVFDPVTNSYFLRNSNTPGAADLVFTFGVGGEGAIAIAGDWDGDGDDTIGFYVATTRTFFLRNENAGGNADLVFVFGPPRGSPVAGDWNGDGTDTIGVFSRAIFGQGLFSLRNSNSAGDPDLTAKFGNADHLPVVGNWDGR